MKILLAVDGSDYTKRMLAWAAAHDEMFGASHEYTIITVLTPINAHVRSFIDKSAVDSFHADEADAVLRPVLAFAKQQGWNVKVEHPVGHAAETLAEKAKAGHFDLIVMGSHGHSAVGTLFLGSVTQRVIAQSRVPIFIVP
jgi:nucleotide-binding universal stress UspA family protein